MATKKLVNFIFGKESSMCFPLKDIRTRLPPPADIFHLTSVLVRTSGTELLEPGEIVLNMRQVVAVEFYEMDEDYSPPPEQMTQ
jgi:hypothetical protein